MADVNRVRTLHLSSQILAMVGILLVLSIGYDQLVSWGIPSERYASQFNAHRADLERGRVKTMEDLKTRVEFLSRNVPHQLEVEATFLRLVLLIALILVLPVGVGAYLHRVYAQAADQAEHPISAEGLRLISRVETAVVVIVGLGVVAALVGGGSRSFDAADKTESVVRWVADPGDRDLALLADLTREAYKTARDSRKALRIWTTVALSLVTFAFVLGVVLYIFAVRYVMRFLRGRR
jgi:hypothetical protein